MFDLDVWQEIFNTIRKNKLRTFLTGFSVAWGIFMLIVLLAAGNGLKNGFMGNFADRATNTVEVWGGRVSIPVNGVPQGRRIRFDSKDYELVDKKIPNADNVSADVSTYGVASYGGESSSTDMRGIYPTASIIDGIKVIDGRFINEVDMQERRKVALVNERLKTVLFKGEDPLGKWVKMLGNMFQVVGVYELSGGWGNSSTIYVPFTTAQQLFNRGFGINSVSFTIEGLNTREENEAFNKTVREQFARQHNVSPEDTRAIGIYNQMENFLQTISIFNAISLFVGIIGIFTLIAGIVGVSNIMLITVRERTKEFGIRKALGATPASILRLILLESVLITGLFGYVGMVAGIGLSELVNAGLEAAAAAGGDMMPLRNTTVSLSIAVIATAVLMLAGVLAGYFPARKAIQITAVEAMRTE